MNHIEHVTNAKAAIATAATYATSGTLVAGSYMDYLNDNAGAFGVLLGLATCLTNFLFQWFNRRALLKARLDNDSSVGD